MDALTEALNAVRIRSAVHCPIEVAGAWGVSAEGTEGATFFIVLQGHCWIEAGGEEPRRLDTGDFAVVTRLLPHTIRTAPDTPLISLATFLANNPKGPDGMLRCGAGGEKSMFIAGCFYFEDFQTSPLLRALPAILHVSGEQGKAFGLETTIRSVLAEALSGRPGAEIVLTRLSDILFIQALRAYLTQLPDCETNWFRAALDPQIGKALTAIHQTPAHDWQVSTLAAQSAMSRSAFAARFTELVGESPLRYVTRWRIHKAARLLCEQNYSVAQVAAESGYQSEAAFSKVFKQWTGRTPTAFRRSTE
jgi:AraC-like DNA-binding protein